jgi:hypothetical protein
LVVELAKAKGERRLDEKLLALSNPKLLIVRLPPKGQSCLGDQRQP